MSEPTRHHIGTRRAQLLAAAERAVVQAQATLSALVEYTMADQPPGAALVGVDPQTGDALVQMPAASDD
jgi:hypothetical protein